MSAWPPLSRGGRERWETRLTNLNPRVAAATGHPVLLLEDRPNRAHVARRDAFTWLEVDYTWLYHRARMQDTRMRGMRSVAAYVLATLYERANGVELSDAFVGRALKALELPLEPAQSFAASLNPLDPLTSAAEPSARLFGLSMGYHQSM